MFYEVGVPSFHLRDMHNLHNVWQQLSFLQDVEKKKVSDYGR